MTQIHHNPFTCYKLTTGHAASEACSLCFVTHKPDYAGHSYSKTFYRYITCVNTCWTSSVIFLTSEKYWFGKIFRPDYRNNQCFERGKMKGLANKVRGGCCAELCSHCLLQTCKVLYFKWGSEFVNHFPVCALRSYLKSVWNSRCSDQATGWRIRDSIQGGGKKISLYQNVHTDFGVHPALCLVLTGFSCPESQAAGAWIYPLTSNYSGY